jgi:hypothetical protein
MFLEAYNQLDDVVKEQYNSNNKSRYREEKSLTRRIMWLLLLTLFPFFALPRSVSILITLSVVVTAIALLLFL